MEQPTTLASLRLHIYTTQTMLTQHIRQQRTRPLPDFFHLIHRRIADAKAMAEQHNYPEIISALKPLSKQLKQLSARQSTAAPSSR